MNKLRLLDFDDLLILRHLLRGETLSAAAKSLGLTQPAVTQRVRKIESILSFQLLEKHGRHARLTVVGESMARKVIHVLDLLEEMEKDPTGEIVHIGSAFDSLVLPIEDAIFALSKIRKDVTFNFISGEQGDLLSRLTNHVMTAVIAAGSTDDSRFFSLPIKNVDLLLVTARQQLPEGSGNSDPVNRVFIEYPGVGLDSLRLAAGGRPQFQRVWRVANAQFALKAVAQGLGITAVPKVHFLRRLDLQTFAEVNLSGIELLPLSISLRGFAEERSNTVFQNLIDLLQGEAASAALRDGGFSVSTKPELTPQ